MDEESEICTRAAVDKLVRKAFLQALQGNDFATLESMLLQRALDVDTVFEVEDEKLVLASYKRGFWLPNYKMTSSWATGLHISAMLGHIENLLVLLRHNATINCRPNGKTPLHVACDVANVECLKILLNHGAKINCYSMGGHAPLHLCKTQESIPCAKQLIWRGANVNIKSNNEMEETPLHTAARFGIPELLAFYISHGANVDSRNAELETPLATAAYWTLEMKEQLYSQNHHLICRMLLDYSTNINARDEDLKSPLHKAAWNCDHILLQMLLEAGAEANSMDVNGCAPIQYVLKVTGVRPAAEPEICYQLLLNHGAARIYPPQFHKVLESCNAYPKAVEVMANAYEHVKSTSKWSKAIPKDAMEAIWVQFSGAFNILECINRSTFGIERSVFRAYYKNMSKKAHRDFYDSLFAACGTTPRTLMHLARCAVRSALWSRCHQVIPQLTLPSPIKKYLLLEPEGVIY